MSKTKFGIWLLFTFTTAVSLFHESHIGHFKNTINIDGIGYNAWLPATFIYKKDYNWAFKDSNLNKIPEYQNRVQFFTYPTKNGSQINKYSPGLAITQAPLWLIARGIAGFGTKKITGYELPFQLAVFSNNLLWLFVGIYLFAILLFEKGFSSFYIWTITGLLIFATNLFHFITFDNSLTHPVNLGFSFIAFFLIYRWSQTDSFRYFVGFCAALVVLLLLRPFNVIMLPFFVLPLIVNKKSSGIFSFFYELFRRKNLIAIVFSVLIFCFIYFGSIYLQTGHWIDYTYQKETFNFKEFHFFELLFGFRCGLILYTPIAFFGFLFLWRSDIDKRLKASWFIWFLAVVFFISTWGEYCYGCRVGNRPLVDYYGVLLFPLLWVDPEKIRIKKYWFWIVPVFFLYYNQILHYQYRHYIMDWCNMDSKKFMRSFLLTHKPMQEDGL